MLVALVQYAKHGIAFPSVATLSEDIGGMHKRDIENALAVLEAARIIEPAEPKRQGRTTRWRVLASEPIDDQDDDSERAVPNLPGSLRGYPGKSDETIPPGSFPGSFPGDLQGYPGSKRSEEINPPIPQHVESSASSVERQGDGGNLQSIDDLDGIPETYRNWLNERRPDSHPHEPHTRRKLARMHARRRLPIAPDELLRLSYDLGHGDPWAGVQIVDNRTAGSLDGTRDPAAALLSRFTKTPSPAHR